MATETTTLNAAATAFYPTASVTAGAGSSPSERRNGTSRRARQQTSNVRRPRGAAADGDGSPPSNNDHEQRAPNPHAKRKPAKKNGSAPSDDAKPVAATQVGAETVGAGLRGSDALVPASVQRRRKQPKGSTGTKPKGSAASATTTSTHEHLEDDDDAEFCLLCTDPIKFYAVGECNHHGICSKCALRMRMLMNDRNCPICKQNQDRVIVCNTKRDFESFLLWGDAGGRDSVLDEASDIIFYECRPHYSALRSLREFGCRMKKCKAMCGSLHKLKDHLRIEHGSEFCELCLTHQHFFIQEHQIYSKAGLRAHNIGRNKSIGPKASGKDFHPMCQFCKRRFYGDLQLYEHLERDHFRCHMCKNEHEYFRNYTSLEAHYRREHFLCEDPVCLQNRFVVFPNDIEYNAHMRAIHGVMNRLMLNFQVARTGENPLGGTAAIAEDAPDSWSFETHEAVNPRVQLENAFPALPTPAAPAPPPLAQPAIPPRAVTRQNSAPNGTIRPGAPTSGPPRGQAVRNQRLAEALGLATPGQAPEAFERELKTPNYPSHLVDWGKANLSYLQVVERRLERIVQDPGCHSVSLRPMPAEERALMHELAAFYGVHSESFGEDPHRRLSFYKRETAQVPEITLSKFLRGPTQGRSGVASRLSFLPLRGQPPTQQATPAPPRPSVPVNRGWEKIEPKRAPVIADAWSDDDEDEKAASSDVNGAQGEDDE